MQPSQLHRCAQHMAMEQVSAMERSWRPERPRRAAGGEALSRPIFPKDAAGTGRRSAMSEGRLAGGSQEERGANRADSPAPYPVQINLQRAPPTTTRTAGMPHHRCRRAHSKTACQEITACRKEPPHIHQCRNVLLGSVRAIQDQPGPIGR